MTYSSSLNATATAWPHQARACFMAANTALSSDRGLKRSTFKDASCNPKACDTSARKRVRSFLGMDRIRACTIARSKINSADGRGSDGIGSVSGTRQPWPRGYERQINSQAYRANKCESRHSAAIRQPKGHGLNPCEGRGA